MSKIISKSEKDLGVSLFDHKGRQIKSNIYGKAFLPRVNRIFMELEDGMHELSDIKEKENNNQASGTLMEIRQQLETGTIDYCISSPPVKAPDIECSSLYTEALCNN